MKFNGWMDDLRIYVLFNRILVIYGQWAGIELTTARSVGHRLTH